jgi:hypothetical protein
LPWTEIAGPLAAAEDAVARLDERLRSSPIREGWIARTHFAEAAASLWLAGELVSLEDLVLHDAGMDIRTPTHDLARAHAVLRARRRIAAAHPGWALTPAGLDALRRKRPPRGSLDGEARAVASETDEDQDACLANAHDDRAEDGDAWAAEMGAIDAVVARSARVLVGMPAPGAAERDPLVHDLDWDENARLSEWRTVIDQTAVLPPVLAAAIALDAWDTIAPLQHVHWLGRLLAAALLRARGKTRSHLACMSTGLRATPRERRLAQDRTVKLQAQLEAIAVAAEAGQKDHDRWMLARHQLARRLTGRRSTSKLPALIDLILATPIASAGMIADRLGITPRAAQDLVVELGVREATGRGRYRAWGIL